MPERPSGTAGNAVGCCFAQIGPVPFSASSLAAETHKFEAHYLDSLLRPLPQAAAIYRERSPLRFADRIRRPLAVFQGEIDRVVPRQQSDAVVEALKRNNVPHVYHVYEGEGHGWRKRDTIEHFYRTAEAFLRQYVLFA